MDSIRAQEIHQQIIRDQPQYLNLTEREWDGLMEARLAFRNLLQDHSLLDLVGDESECVEWLERQVLELIYSITKRERLRELLRRAKEGLKREQEARTQGGKPPGVNEEILRPPKGKRFRRFCLPITVTE
jgi:hypothetical protein